MNKHRNGPFKSSRETARSLAKEAIKRGSRVEEEGSFPIYMMVLSHDRNDDILIIHPYYSCEPFNNNSTVPKTVKKLPGDKPLRIINGKKPDNPDNNSDNTEDETI